MPTRFWACCNRASPGRWSMLRTRTPASTCKSLLSDAMENIVQNTSAEPVIEITNVGGDLRITGWEQNQFVAESDDANGVHFDQDGDRLRLQAREDVTIRLPQAAQISVRNVGGDARIIKLAGQPLAIGNI